MGVADNRTYKHEYLFTDPTKSTISEYPSIKDNDKINTTLKENPYRSNVEVEGGEVILAPDLTSLHKASGKRHSQGGMDVLLKPESFVFSDFKDLKMTEDDLERFELKEGKGRKIDTPAEVLKKNVPLKHYNSMVNILDDPYKDDLAKKTAAMMLEKYIQMIGNIAYAQEEKKGFPEGIPAFSMGTAPVYDPSIKSEIEENKQYAKAGGSIKNPYKMQYGGYDPMETIRQRQAIEEARRQKELQENEIIGNLYLNPAQRRTNILSTAVARPAPATGTPPITPPTQNQSTAAQNNTKAVTDGSNPGWGLHPGDKLPLFQDRFGITNAADKIGNLDRFADMLGYTGPKNNKAFQEWLYNSSPENRAIIDKWHKKYGQPYAGNPIDSIIGVRWQNAIKEMLMTKLPPQKTPDLSRRPLPTPSNRPPDFNDPEQFTPQGSKQADWRFTPWQRLSQLYNLGQYASVKRYMPYRSRYNATYVDPSLVNPEQAVGDVRAAGAQQLSSLTTLNPILRNAQAASIAGQVMDKTPGIRSQYDNQNAQILNNTAQYNVQTRNNESLVNMGNDQQYWREMVEGRKNFDNMRTYMSNQFMNNLFRDVETNQKLSYNLLTQNQPAYGFDWRSGNFYRNPVDILDVQGNQVNSRYQALQEMLDQITDPTEKVKQAIKLEGIKAFGAAQPAPNLFKKGGKAKKNPYRY